MSVSRVSWWFLSVLLAFGQTYATLTNITVDDTNSTYFTFVGSWNAITPGTPCTKCALQPDAGLAYNRTWHDGTLLSGTFSFQGTAVYIYGIDVAKSANVTFAMSNPTINSFHYSPPNGYVYNSLFFSATGLDATVPHSVSWLLERSSVGTSALFDYAVVTLDVPDTSSSSAGASSSSAGASSTGSTSTVSSAPSQSPSGTVTQTKKKSHTGAIVGAVVGVIVGLALVGALFLFLRRRQSSEVPAGTTDNAYNFHGSDAGPNRRTGYTGYTVEPYQLLDLPRPGPFVHSEADSGSMSGAPMAAVRSAPISNTTGGPPHIFQSPSVVPSDAPHTSSLSAGSMAAVRPEPVLRPSASSPSSKRVPAPPVTLAWDPNDPSGQRTQDLSDVQERLRHLEEFVAAFQPPTYS